MSDSNTEETVDSDFADKTIKRLTAKVNRLRNAGSYEDAWYWQGFMEGLFPHFDWPGHRFGDFRCTFMEGEDDASRIPGSERK